MTGALALKPIPSKAGIEDKFSETRQKFLSRYPNRARHITKKLGDQRWTTVKGPLFTGLIDAAISCDTDHFVGAHWGQQTNFAVLDIDACSTYHTQESLAKLMAAVDSVALKANLYQSSNSGGWHLYLPFSDQENSSQVEQTLKRWLKHLGYEIVCGQLEVFPSGNALRLPLQKGFAWLDQDGSLLRTREEVSLKEALSYFIEDQEANAQSWTIAKNRIESQIRVADRAAGSDAQERRDRLTMEGFEELFKYRVIQEQCDKARAYLASGLIESGTRHEAIYAIEHFLWHGDRALGVPALPGQMNADRRYQYLRAWLERNHNGCCRHINRGDWDRVESHIRRACEWQATEVKANFNYEPYKLTERAQDRLIELGMAKNRVFSMDDFRKANEDRQDEARAKIKQAVSDCLQDGRRISRRRLQAITGCSPNTLRKHADLWRGLSNGSGVLISGGLGAGAALLPCSDSDFGEEKKDSSDLEIEVSGQACCVLDSLRCDRTGQTARNSRQETKEVLAAVHPIQSNSGVKHELAGSAPCVAAGGMDCGINGFLPASGSPPFNPHPVFFIGAPAQNLRQVGDRCGGLAYVAKGSVNCGAWISPWAQTQQLDKSIVLVLPLERAVGYVPLSCYVRSKAQNGRLLSSYGYIALGAEAHAMGNESHEKPEEERPTERQTEHVKRAQGEVTNAAESYTEQVKAHRVEKKLSGNSGATGQLPDQDGKGLASAKDLLGDDAHGLSKAEKQAALLAQIERDGYIVGRKADDQELLAQAPKDDPLTKLKNKFEHPGRNNPDASIDYPAAKEAYQRFDLAKHGVDKTVIPALIRNEQYWLGLKDRGPDWIAEERPFMIPPQNRSWSVGHAQIQIRIMEELAAKYKDKLPEFQLPAKQVISVGGMNVGEREADVAMLSFDKRKAALITGAYLANVIDRLESGEQPCPYSEPGHNARIIELWKTGKAEARNEALIRSYNPGEGSKHVKNVLNHMSKIKQMHPDL